MFDLFNTKKEPLDEKTKQILKDHLKTDFLRIKSTPSYIESCVDMWVSLNRQKHRLFEKFISSDEKNQLAMYANFVSSYDVILKQEVKEYDDFLRMIKELLSIIRLHYDKKHLDHLRHAISISGLKKEMKVTMNELNEIKDFLLNKRKTIEHEDQLLRKHKRIAPANLVSELQIIQKKIHTDILLGAKLAKKQTIDLSSYKIVDWDAFSQHLEKNSKELAVVTKGTISIDTVVILISLGLKYIDKDTFESLPLLFICIAGLGFITGQLFSGMAEVYGLELDADVSKMV